MQAEERQQRIEAFLQKAEFASLEELSELVDVSPSSVRRDLQALEARGLVRRTHGGARLVNPRSDEFTFATRDSRQLDEKELIGRACAELIRPNESLILDAGTTVFHVAKYLEPKSPQILTNSLPVANLFASSSRVEVLVSGGVIYPRLGVLVGPLAVETFTKVHADTAIMSSGGITEDGISNSHGLLIDIQRAMIAAAKRVIFCLDHTKFDRRSVSFLCPLDDVDVIVTDSLAPKALVQSLQSRGILIVTTDTAAPDRRGLAPSVSGSHPARTTNVAEP
ncbi:MAG: DeoR/GlpR transcriptional regulator [Verrucomicrobiales bacterium]|nr:DeoR/GlpR transcriptional regulator [Verrucomicrobiales bacterium]